MNEKIEFRFPERIVTASGVENAQTLLMEKTLQIGIGTEETARFSAGSFVILDFGREIVGGARILSWFSPSAVPVRLRFGESVAEVCAEPGEKNATNDHALRDFTLALPQLSDGVYGDTGFRFLRVDAMGELSLKAVAARDKKTSLVPLGDFSCEDERVCEIYRVARETLFCCVQNGYIWDGVKRDRLVWIGDLHPEMMGLLCTVGGTEEVERCLSLAVAQTPLPGWMNGIPSYSLWWIVNLHDYYAHTGKLAFVRGFEEYFSALLSQIDGCVTETGETRFPYDFLDWPTHGQADECAGQAGLLRLAMEKAVALSEALGSSDAAKRLLIKVSARRDRVEVSKQAEAMRVLSGAVSAREAAAMLAREGCRGVSTFMSYYIFRAMAEGGRGEEALSCLKTYYGGMLSRGARTFWEDFSIDWLEGSGRVDELPSEGVKDIHGDYGAFCYTGFRHSLCHGWSCGPVPFLTHVVLGVRVLEAGCRTLAVSPDLCGLKHVKGSYPTPYGKVEIEHTLNGDGRVESVVKAPKEVSIRSGPAKGLIS